jgi:type II secretory pathway pseudopilin PulG
MIRTIKGQRGMSLVEATIILSVLAVLTSVLSPSIGDYVNDARQVKVKEDCEAIGTSIARIVRDVGACIRKSGEQGCTKANRVDLLFSSGPDVAAGDLASSAASFSSGALAGVLNWDRDDAANADSMERQFVLNGPTYPTPASLGTYAVSGPQTGLGWRGAYLSSPIGPDPWGRRYLANTAFLSVATDAEGAGEGARSGGWSHDVFCISGGPNAVFETPIGGVNTGTGRLGDDFVYIVSGGTR